HRTAVAAGGPLSLDVASYPGAPSLGIPYVGYVKIGKNGPLDLTPLPRGTGTACFSIPPTGGSPVVLLNTLGHAAALGRPLFAGTPLGPGAILSVPKIPPKQQGLVFTSFLIVLDRYAPNGRVAVSNALVVTVQ